MMIVDLPSTFKPPSKTAKPKPKSVSTPQNDNDTDKETLPSPDTYCILLVVTASSLWQSTPSGSSSASRMPPLHPKCQPLHTFVELSAGSFIGVRRVGAKVGHFVDSAVVISFRALVGLWKICRSFRCFFSGRKCVRQGGSSVTPIRRPMKSPMRHQFSHFPFLIDLSRVSNSWDFDLGVREMNNRSTVLGRAPILLAVGSAVSGRWLDVWSVVGDRHSGVASCKEKMASDVMICAQHLVLLSREIRKSTSEFQTKLNKRNWVKLAEAPDDGIRGKAAAVGP
eukprot:scaffold73704_cov71-Attheya_sp.AAC.2